MVPDNITKEHVLQAIADIDKNGLRYSLAKSSVYFLVYNSKRYPPKYTIQLANEFANGDFLEYSTLNTFGAQNALKRISDDFVIIKQNDDPNLELITRYKKYLEETKLQEEVYKWQLLEEFKGRPDLNAENFTEEIKGINFSNLIYGVGIGVTNHIARDAPEKYRNCFKVLFDESIPLADRLKSFGTETLDIYRSLGIEKVSHHQDERTMSTFLTYHNPDKYAFYKDSFYQKYCKLIDADPALIYEKYPHYLALLNDFIAEYISSDNDLLNTLNKLLPDKAFEDGSHLLLAQDILYQTLDKQYGVGKTYWRVGTTDSKQSYWSTMLSNKKVAIGWSDLGDLNSLKIKSKKEIETALNKRKYYQGKKGLLSRKAGEIFNFYNDVKIGDVILAQDGQKVVGIGIVKDEYQFVAGEGFPHQKEVDWRVLNPGIDNKQGLQTSVYKIDDPSIINKVNKILNEPMVVENEATELEAYPLNQILYGPPGTGKTYNSIDLAVKIIKGALGDHKKNKPVFDKLKEDGQIEFITFHQNYSYEDFMVGLRPDPENEILKFAPHKGVFYRIAQTAKENYLASKEERGIAKDFDTVLTELFQPLESGGEVEIKMVSGISYFITDVTNSTIKFRKSNKSTNHTLSIDTLKEIVQGTRILHSGLVVYYNPLAKLIKEKQQVESAAKERLKRFVLIIDEINRANISRVFGELITLLEEDKRLGGDNELTITLPNGEKNFGVPPNLYVLGTMNTADKSIALIDIALRRRFEFDGRYPNYDVLEKEGLSEHVKLLKSINKSIFEKKKTADYLIGHAYFLSGDTIQNILLKKVIPLLNEYFGNRNSDVINVFNGSDWIVKFNENTYCWEVEKKTLPDA